MARAAEVSAARAWVSLGSCVAGGESVESVGNMQQEKCASKGTFSSEPAACAVQGFLTGVAGAAVAGAGFPGASAGLPEAAATVAGVDATATTAAAGGG